MDIETIKRRFNQGNYSESVDRPTPHAYDHFKKDLRAVLNERLGHDCEVDDEQFNAVYDKAWLNGHTHGLGKVISEFQALVEIVVLFDPFI